ncbi:MAG: hypothetical protein ACJZ8J_02115 [Candidatus Pelagibacter sp.]
MFKSKLIISIGIFSILLSTTSVIKTQSRIIEKKIYKVEQKIKTLEKDLHETELDYSYLSAPNNLSKKIKDLSFIDYVPMDFSRIYMSYKDFSGAQKKITILKMNDEKTKQKK